MGWDRARLQWPRSCTLLLKGPKSCRVWLKGIMSCEGSTNTYKDPAPGSEVGWWSGLGDWVGMGSGRLVGWPGLEAPLAKVL